MNDRQKAILRILGEDGELSVSALAERFDVGPFLTGLLASGHGMGMLIGSMGLVLHARLGDGIWSVARIVAATMVVGFGLVTACLSNFVGSFVLVIFTLPLAMLLFAWPAHKGNSSKVRQDAKEEVLV